MNTLGSHPGAIIFRLSLMIIIIALLMLIFFAYLDDTERGLEKTSIQQTKRVIDASLAVVFSTYAVSGRLHELDRLDGGNPFTMLEEIQVQVPGYQGTRERDLRAGLEAGWYYLSHRRLVAYKSRFDAAADRYFLVRLEYDDLDASGAFEPASDRFRRLLFVAADRI